MISLTRVRKKKDDFTLTPAQVKRRDEHINLILQDSSPEIINLYKLYALVTHDAMVLVDALERIKNGNYQDISEACDCPRISEEALTQWRGNE